MDLLRDAEHDSDQEELMKIPEVQQKLREFLETHWNQWVDVPLPALHGKTPREAVADPDGREVVETLLRDFERNDQGKLAPVRFDFNRLRQELGLLVPQPDLQGDSQEGSENPEEEPVDSAI